MSSGNENKAEVKMTSAKEIVITAIKHKGVTTVKANAKSLAESALCTKAYILSIILKVEKGKIIVM